MKSTTETTPKISVCIATYNGEKYIHEQLDSIISQLSINDEIIISDDSSTDNTLKIIQQINDTRITLLKENTFQNPTFNFENALKKATGDIIILSDQDDIWLPEKVQTTLSLLKNNDLVLCNNRVVDENGNKLHDSFFAVNHSTSGIIHNIFKNSYIGCCMAFNRKILLRSLPFPKDIPMHDWWIGMIAESCGKVHFHEEPLVLYRRHSNNASESGGKSSFNFLKKIQFRLILIKNLIKRSIFNV